MRNTRLSNFVIFALSIFALSSCAKKNIAVAATATTPSVISVSDEPQILFIQLKILKKDKNANYEASVVNKKSANGVLDKPLRGINLIEGRWLMSLLDVEQKVIAKEMILDPINEHLEYSDDKGKLQGVEVEKKETDCFVRVQNSPNFRFLKCELILANKQLKPLFLLKL